MDKGSGSTETLYEVLKLRNDASDKEIRNAYVQLSKQVSLKTYFGKINCRSEMKSVGNFWQITGLEFHPPNLRVRPS